MTLNRIAFVLCLLWPSSVVVAQIAEIRPQVTTRQEVEGNVATVEVSAHFVTVIRMAEEVNSVVVGDPALFQVEHSEREPQLVFVKALTLKPAETNLLIATIRGHEESLLVVSRGEQNSGTPATVDFLLKYKPAWGFFIEPKYPSTLVAQTVPVVAGTHAVPPLKSTSATSGALANPDPPSISVPETLGERKRDSLDELLTQQESAQLPTLYGERVTSEKSTGNPVRVGVSRVVDGGQQVIALFSVVNPTAHNILLMPPQVQLGGKIKSGKFIRRSHWLSADQLQVIDFRLSRRRLGPGDRADGVVLFERPPYKQSNETLFLQMAEAGAVDRPALAPIGFGISTKGEESDHGEPAKGK